MTGLYQIWFFGGWRQLMARTDHWQDQTVTSQEMPHLSDHAMNPPATIANASTLRPIAPTGDRSKAFRTARVHSWIVRSLRLAFPIATACAAGIYAVSALKTSGWGQIASQLPIPKITAENLTMENPRYTGFTKDGGSYVISAASAQQDFDNTDFIKLETINGEMLDSKKSKTFLVATRGTFNTKKNILVLRDGIDITSQDGMRAILKTATVQTKTGIVTSDEPVKVAMSAGRINADTMRLNRKTRKVSFQKNVVARLTPKTNKDTATRPKADGKTPAAPLIGGSNAPIDITASRLDVDDQNATAAFIGRVRAVQDDATLSTKQLDIEYENSSNNSPNGQSGTAKAATPPASGQAAKVRRIIARYPVLMTQGTDRQVTSQSADFDAINETALLIGKVVMIVGADRRALADRAELDSRADTALLEGNVVVKQGINELRGQRLFVDRQAGRTKLTSPKASNGKPGRIHANFAAGDPKPAPTSATPSKAAGNGNIFAFKTTPGAPVEIDANSLLVDDAVKTAVFTGNVQARQGAFLIRTIRLTATYTGSAQLGDPSAEQTKTDKKKTSTDLTRVQAKGKVIITSENGQKASGDWADFNIKRNTVLLGGDVVLTQGKNIIRGSRLAIDMTTGRSVIDTDPNSASGGWASSLRDGTGAEKALPESVQIRGGRPRAVFYPSQLSGKKKAKKAKKQPTSTSSSSNRSTRKSIPEASSWAPVTQ